jgi:hypothetical protein
VRSISKIEGRHATQQTRKLSHKTLVSSSDSSSAARYFKNYKLDYPNAETNKASKKYVKAMKKLPVGADHLNTGS